MLHPLSACFHPLCVGTRQGTPSRVVCGPAEDCAVSLALAGALALARTILALQDVGGLLGSFSLGGNSPASPTAVSCKQGVTFEGRLGRSFALLCSCLGVPPKRPYLPGHQGCAPVSEATRPCSPLVR